MVFDETSFRKSCQIAIAKHYKLQLDQLSNSTFIVEVNQKIKVSKDSDFVNIPFKNFISKLGDVEICGWTGI